MYTCPVCGYQTDDAGKLERCLMFHMGISDKGVFQQWKSMFDNIQSLSVRVQRNMGNQQERAQWPLDLQAAIDEIHRFEAKHNINGDLSPRPMNAVEVLNRWADFSDYNPDERQFNLLSVHYTYHQCTDRIRSFMEYDQSGALGVIYARQVFEDTLTESRVRAIELVKNPHGLDDEIEMWRVFHHPDILAIEQSLLDRIDSIVAAALPNKMLGERDAQQERRALVGSVSAVVEQLDKCHLDVYSYETPLTNLTRFSTRIHVFPTLSQCLLTLESGHDGIYLCYIENSGTIDGWFGFFMKSGHTLISIHERVDEAYPGQHGYSRNGRWSEAKADQLFPYEHILSFSDHDYKGYAKKQVIDPEQLEFFKLPANGYLPLILAMVLLVNKYQEKDLSDVDPVFVDSLLAVNLPELPSETQALVPVSGSAIMTRNRSLNIHLTTENLLDGSFVKRFENRRWANERGSFQNNNQLFVDLYGQDFQLDTSSLLRRSTYPALTDGKQTLPQTHEFIGNRNRMEVELYREARIQLAEHIRDKMAQAYRDAGGRDGIRKWFRDCIRRNKARIIDICMEQELLSQYHEQDGRKGRENQWPFVRRVYYDNTRFDSYDCNGANFLPLNQSELDKWGHPSGRYRDLSGGNWCKVFFLFNPHDWEQLQSLFPDEKLPVPVMGWQESRINMTNSLLDATDAVNEIGTVFEYRETQRNKRLWTKHQWQSYYIDKWLHDHDESYQHKEAPDDAFDISPQTEFHFTVGFSNRDLARRMKDFEAKEEAEQSTT